MHTALAYLASLELAEKKRKYPHVAERGSTLNDWARDAEPRAVPPAPTNVVYVGRSACYQREDMAVVKRAGRPCASGSSSCSRLTTCLNAHLLLTLAPWRSRIPGAESIMFDGIKILDLSVSAEALLSSDRLRFPLPIDERTGAILPQPRQAPYRGLTFSLVPTIKGNRLRCELKGSLHRFHNQGRHNADQFTAAQLLTTIDELVNDFGINPFASRLNNLEFGVNVQLPFPVSQVLGNLISYKYRPFQQGIDHSRMGEPFPYWQCQTQRYALKLYDKGQQYRLQLPDLSANLLRLEMKVFKMEFLACRGIALHSLAELIKVESFGSLGGLLVEAFETILFDEPTIQPEQLPPKVREVYLNGRNPRFWTLPDELERTAYDRCQKQLKRTDQSFRDLLARHRQGPDWQTQTGRLIDEAWRGLTRIDEGWLASQQVYWQRWLTRSGSPGETDQWTARAA